MVTATVAVGIGVIGVGLILMIVGFTFLAKELSKVQQDLQTRAQGLQTKGVIGNMADLLKQINELIDKVGAAKGIPMAIMIFGLVLVAIGATIVGVSV